MAKFIEVTAISRDNGTEDKVLINTDHIEEVNIEKLNSELSAHAPGDIVDNIRKSGCAIRTTAD